MSNNYEKLYTLFKFLLFFSFFLPFIKGCEFGGRKAEETTSDSLLIASVYIDSLTIDDSIRFSKETIEIVGKEQANTEDILAILFDNLISPDYAGDPSFTGFGVCFFTVADLIQEPLKEFEFILLFLPLSFILSFVSLFIRINKRYNSLLLNAIVLICLVAFLILFRAGIALILIGFWTALVLVTINLIILTQIKSTLPPASKLSNAQSADCHSTEIHS